MLSDHSLFLSAIAASPEDDLPRLVFADWLDEHGDPDRAEFIRLQIARYRTKADPRHMKARIKQLLNLHRARWNDELPVIPGVEWGRYWRGVISEVKFDDPMALIEQAETVFATMPVRVVQLTGLEPYQAESVSRRLQHRNLYGLRLDEVAPNPVMWRIFTGSEWFGKLRHLIAHPRNRSSAETTEGDLEVVHLILGAANREHSRLRKLHLDFPDIDEYIVRNLYSDRILLTGLGGFDPL